RARLSALLKVMMTTDSGSRDFIVLLRAAQQAAPQGDQPPAQQAPPGRVEGQMGVEREKVGHQGEARGGGSPAGPWRTAPPCAHGPAHAEKPQGKAGKASAGGGFQQPLMGVACAFSRAAGLAGDERIV